MKFSITVISILISLLISQLAYSDSITDTYNPGDTLTATTLDNIKSAVNDNDARISALEANTAPVIKKAGWVNNLGQPLGDFSIPGPGGPFWIIDQGIAWKFRIDNSQAPYYVQTDKLFFDQPGCTGNAYVLFSNWVNLGSTFGEIATQQGGVDFNHNLYVGDLSAGKINILIASETGWQPNTNLMECKDYASPPVLEVFNAIPAPFDNANNGTVTFDLLP